MKGLTDATSKDVCVVPKTLDSKMVLLIRRTLLERVRILCSFCQEENLFFLLRMRHLLFRERPLGVSSNLIVFFLFIYLFIFLNLIFNFFTYLFVPYTLLHFIWFEILREWHSVNVKLMTQTNGLLSDLP